MVKIKDKAGNRADVDGKFSTYVAPPPKNVTENQTTTQPTQPEGQGIPLLDIVGGVIILVLAVYLVIHMKSKGSGSS
jgi:hypothetical protein